MPPMHEWTILLYMAGDNGATFQTKYGSYSLFDQMTGAGYEDIGEVEKIGTTDRVAVVAQFDTLPSKDPLAAETLQSQGGTYRLEIHRGRSVKDNIVETIPEANTGDPAELARFVVWGMSRCPAKRTLLVLWNHGTGWKEDPIYDTVKAQSREAELHEEEREKNVTLFRSTARKALEMGKKLPGSTRAILYDDTSMDFLSNQEMSAALRVAEVATDEAEVAAMFADENRLQQVLHSGSQANRRRLDAIGMDACLMAMLEVQYQVRQFAGVLIASQEVEPLKGWPYTPIVQALNANPGMTDQELGKLVVQEYEASYPGQAITQSAVDLTKMEEAATKVATLAGALAAAYSVDPALRDAFLEAGEATRGLFSGDRDYVDLARFVGLLREAYYSRGGANYGLLNAADAVRDWIRSPNGPVLANAATGKYQDPATAGLSIYLPQCYSMQGHKEEVSKAYETLDWAGAGWYQMLQAVHEYPG